MSQSVRIESPGTFDNVMVHGNRLDPIFISPNGEDQELNRLQLDSRSAKLDF